MVTKDEKIEWAKRAFAKIASDCEEIASMGIISKAEKNTWLSFAKEARHNIKILERSRREYNEQG